MEMSRSFFLPLCKLKYRLIQNNTSWSIRLKIKWFRQYVLCISRRQNYGNAYTFIFYRSKAAHISNKNNCRSDTTSTANLKFLDLHNGYSCNTRFNVYLKCNIHLYLFFETHAVYSATHFVQFKEFLICFSLVAHLLLKYDKQFYIILRFIFFRLKDYLLHIFWNLRKKRLNPH